MVDDIVETAIDLLGDLAELVIGRKRGKKAPSSQPLPSTKVTANRRKTGEDPWDWKEPPPPWEK